MFSFSGSSNDTDFLVVPPSLESERTKLDFNPGVGLVVGTRVVMVPVSYSFADDVARFLVPVAFLGVWPGAAKVSLSLCSSAAGILRTRVRVAFGAGSDATIGTSDCCVPDAIAIFRVLVRIAGLAAAVLAAVAAVALDVFATVAGSLTATGCSGSSSVAVAAFFARARRRGTLFMVFGCSLSVCCSSSSVSSGRVFRFADVRAAMVTAGLLSILGCEDADNDDDAVGTTLAARARVMRFGGLVTSMAETEEGTRRLVAGRRKKARLEW